MLPLSKLRPLCLGLLLVAGIASAHDSFESTTIVRLRPATLELEITMARSTALAAVSPDGAPTASFEPEQFESIRPKLAAGAPELFVITAGGTKLEPQRVDVALGVEFDVEFRLVYPRPPPGPVDFFARHVVRLGYGYGSTLTFDFPDGQSPPMKLLMADDTLYQIVLPAVSPTAAPASPSAARVSPAAAPATPASGFGPFLRLGIGHILTGYDHLLFLCGLLVVCRSLRSMVGIITCFTLAHSLTLALAALGVFALPGRIVEPLIAASIVFVGVENLLRHGEPKGRWALTFAFGLIHGFGFAGVLKDIGLGTSGAGIALPLFSFNLGVELGQLGVVAVVLPLLLWLRARPAFVRVGQPAVSALVASAGLFWLLQRTVLS